MTESKEKLIEEMFNRGFLLNQELLEKELASIVVEKAGDEKDLIVLNADYADLLEHQSGLVDWYEVDEYRVKAEKNKDDSLYFVQIQQLRRPGLLLSPIPAAGSESTSSASPEPGLKSNYSAFFSEQEWLSSVSSALDSEERLGLGPGEELNSFSLPALNVPKKTMNGVSSLSPVKILFSPQSKPRKYEIKDFSRIFSSRYRFLEGLLHNRAELQGTTSVSRLLEKKEKEQVAAIGLVDEISLTKTGHLIVTLEDLTGKIKILFSKNNKELFLSAKELVHDEVIGITGSCNNKMFFAESIVWPDLPANDLKKSPVEEYAVFLSDIHVGSKMFLKEEFEKFLHWINSDIGNESQKELAKKVKYILIAGDLVDGIGVYPSQEEELEIKDISKQYDYFCDFLAKIPADKQIIICPGNHDLVHLAEPQPAFYPEYAPRLFKFPNVILVTNPALVNIGQRDGFPGFDILMYHGYSFDYYIANVESIRNNGGYRRADLVMKFLLKRRHLAPSFKSTPYLPLFPEDPLLIRKIPDFFLTGHIHYSNVANYRGITMISGSCWQGKTSFQEKMGHEPEPGRVPLVNLKTREVKILKFV